MLLTCIRGIPLASSLQYTQSYTQAISSVRVNQFKFVFSGQCLLLGVQSLKILSPWPGCDPLTSHNLWLLNLEPCTLHSSPPAPPNPTQLLGGRKDYQRVTEGQDKHKHHWSARCSKQLLLAQGQQHLVLLVL